MVAEAEATTADANVVFEGEEGENDSSESSSSSDEDESGRAVSNNDNDRGDRVANEDDRVVHNTPAAAREDPVGRRDGFQGRTYTRALSASSAAYRDAVGTTSAVALQQAQAATKQAAARTAANRPSLRIVIAPAASRGNSNPNTRASGGSRNSNTNARGGGRANYARGANGNTPVVVPREAATATTVARIRHAVTGVLVATPTETTLTGPAAPTTSVTHIGHMTSPIVGERRMMRSRPNRSPPVSHRPSATVGAPGGWSPLGAIGRQIRTLSRGAQVSCP